MLPILLNQIFRNKNDAEKSNQRSFKEALLLLWTQLKSLSILAWIWKKIEPTDESLKLVNKSETCKTKTHKSNTKTSKNKQPNME